MKTNHLFSEVVVERAAQPPLKLQYYIVRSNDAYGVEIVMDCAGESDRACVSDITASKTRVEGFAQTLCEHYVTPCTLKDVVLDFLNAV